MSTFLDIALQHIGRGWYVHPLKAVGKVPITPHGKNDATLDETVIRDWWSRTPNANVGISCGPSNLCVLDADHGLKDEAEFLAWRDRNGLPVTYTVRSGRRPEFGVQSYYMGGLKDGKFELDGVTGEIKSLGGLVLAAGCIHPTSKERYYVLVDAPLAPMPAVIEQSRKNTDATGKREWNLPVHDGEGRDHFLISQAGRLRNVGASETIIRAHLEEINSDPSIMADPKSDADLDRIARSAARYDVSAEPRVLIGSRETKITDWRSHYHSADEMEHAPPAAFLIEGFLQQDAITALAAPVAQRKSLISLNVAHALCTGEPLFDYFKVTNPPARVLYLCPEMGIRSFTERVRKIGLLPHIGKTLFCRTMSAEGTLALEELTAEELDGAVVVIDTAVRYLKGDENSSEHMRAFAESIFRLMRDGAVSVLLLHHSAKGTKESAELSLENAMRGSGELGAFVSSCWATRLQNPAEPYQSASFLTNVKQRDFESKPFEVTCTADCRLHIADAPSDNVRLSSKSAGAPADADGNEEAAIHVIRDNPTLSIRKTVEKLEALGIKRSKTWIGNKRHDVLNVGVKTS